MFCYCHCYCHCDYLMKPILDWLDSRTGYRGMAKAMLYEHIPGGARWRGAQR